MKLLNDHSTLNAVLKQSVELTNGYPSWAQYRKLASQLLSPPVINNPIKLYFTTLSWRYCMLEEHYFRSLLQGWLLTDQSTVTKLDQELLCFPALLSQVLAISLRFAPPQAYATSGSGKIQENTCVNLSRHYSEIGVYIMNVLGENGRGVTAVEHYFVRAWWLQLCHVVSKT
jgi:hypothetical protein